MWAKIFDNRNPFWRFMGKLFDIAMLNLLWLTTSLPIVTMGASTAALFNAVYQVIREESESAVRSYFSAWKENWKQGSLLFLIFLLLIALFGFDLFYFSYSQNYLTGTAQAVVCVFVSLFLLFALGSAAYAFSLQVFFENTVSGILKNAVILSLSHLPRTLLIILTNTLYLMAAVLSLYYFPALSILFILFGMGIPVFVDALILTPLIQRQLPPAIEMD
ncbi:MAG: YesL family protein [Faecousia sp.]